MTVDLHLKSPAGLEMIEPLLNHMGLGVNGTESSAIAREAARQRCIKMLNSPPKNGGYWEIGDMAILASAFYEGYLACLNNMKGRPKSCQQTASSVPNK